MHGVLLLRVAAAKGHRTGPLSSRPAAPLARIAFLQYRSHMTWTVEVLDATVRAELEAQPKDIRARYPRIVGLIESHGLERVREPYVQQS
jgi:hypothetical protein